MDEGDEDFLSGQQTRRLSGQTSQLLLSSRALGRRGSSFVRADSGCLNRSTRDSQLGREWMSGWGPSQGESHPCAGWK
jgi:hypothetical protein